MKADWWPAGQASRDPYPGVYVHPWPYPPGRTSLETAEACGFQGVDIRVYAYTPMYREGGVSTIPAHREGGAAS